LNNGVNITPLDFDKNFRDSHGHFFVGGPKDSVTGHDPIRPAKRLTVLIIVGAVLRTCGEHRPKAICHVGGSFV